jgi:outer membrane lipoprotein SlyB
METPRNRLHPLLTAAAISLIVLSAAGIAALTGVLPNSRGSDPQAMAPEAQQPVAQPVTQPAVETPPTKPKRVARHVPLRPVPAQVAAAEPPPPTAMAPLPSVGGVVESVKEVEQKGESTIAGPLLGGIAGAVLGHQVGSGRGKTVATAVGAGAGIFGGKAIEEKVRATKHWETKVRMDDGSTRTVSSESEPSWHAGERVRVVDGQVLKS